MTKPLRVLIVEDSEDDALLVVHQLRRGGYDPDFQQVNTKEQLERALDGGNWDAVITDYSMPRFSAYGTLALLKERGLDIPCIVVSGTIGEETAVLTMKGGAHDYIMKDNLNRLVPAIERELREAGVRRERKHAEEALRESEERYRSLVENVDIGVTLIDQKYNIIMSNAAQRRIFHKIGVDFAGSTCFAEFGDSEDVCGFCPARKTMATGEPQEIEINVPRAHGRGIGLRIRTFPTLGQDAVITGSVVLVEDVTERKHMEEQFRRSAQLEAVGRLAGGIAHDFNNLLKAVIGYSNVLLQQMSKDDLRREKALQINHAAERAADLTRQLLAVGRKQVLTLKVLDVNPVIRDFRKILSRLLGDGIELVMDLEEGIGAIRADPGQIGRILLNFAINSRDAMPEGGTFVFETSSVFLGDDYVRLHPGIKRGEYIRLRVSDDGVGMDLETCSHIFDPFFTTKEEGKGTGLGLSTVYGIVKQHQGHITVHSEPGRGTSFDVYLPMVDEAVEKASEKVVESSRRHGTETILIVEDEEIVRNLAAEVLKMLGYSILVAADPEEALKVVEEYDGPIHLLLTDVALPRLDGPGLFARLSPLRSEMRVLYVSGYSRDAVGNKGGLAKDAHFLQKPFTLDDLAVEVREALDPD